MTTLLHELEDMDMDTILEKTNIEYRKTSKFKEFKLEGKTLTCWQYSKFYKYEGKNFDAKGYYKDIRKLVLQLLIKL